MVGGKTGGGPCALRESVTAIGSGFGQSGITALAKKSNNKFVDIDDGVNADHEVGQDELLDRDFVSTMLDTWYK